MLGRGTWIVAVVFATLGATVDARAGTPTSCRGEGCGVPKCSADPLPARPGTSRVMRVQCRSLVGARLLAAPAHTRISEVGVDYFGIRFVADTAADAPTGETVTFALEGLEADTELRVPIKVIPLDVNEPPRCFAWDVAKRTSGALPAELYADLYCYDPDRDAFTVEGAGPGRHLDGPQSFPAGESGPNRWRYEPATRDGRETATIRATDELGARSADATFEAWVGPSVDRPARCYANGAWIIDGASVVRSRPGVPRRFMMVCDDPDGDPPVPAVEDAPVHGSLSLLPGVPGWIGSAFLAARYEPHDDTGQADEFSVAVPLTNGATVEPDRFRLSPDPVGVNGGLSCGYGPNTLAPAGPTLLHIACADAHGDPQSIEVVEGPRHGTIASPVVKEGLYEGIEATIAYVPEAGYTGPDCVVLRIEDEYGDGFTITYDFVVEPLPVPVPVPTVAAPPLPLPTSAPAVPTTTPAPIVPPLITRPPATGAVDPAVIEAQIRRYVETLLGTTEVRPVAVLPDVLAWRPTRLSRARLRADGRVPALVVFCNAGCVARSSVGSQRSRIQAKQAIAPNTAHVLWATRRGRLPRRMQVSVVVTRAGESARLTRRIPVGP